MHTTRRDVAYVTLSEFDPDGYLQVQPASYGEKGATPFGLNHTYGFASRPHDPDVPEGDGAPPRWCTLMVEKDGSGRIGWLGYDPRFIQDLAVLSKGGSAQYAGWRDGDAWKVSFAIISGDDGTLQFYRPTGEAAISITAGVDGDGEPIIELAHSDGSIVSMFGGSITLKSPDGGTYVEVSDDGIVLKGKITQMGGLSTPGGLSLTKDIVFKALVETLKVQLDIAIPGAGRAFGTAFALAQTATGQADSGTSVTKGT